MQVVQERGGDVRQLQAPEQLHNYSDDYKQCPYCSRKFAQETAARHIPKCKTTINKPKPPPKAALQQRAPVQSSISSNLFGEEVKNQSFKQGLMQPRQADSRPDMNMQNRGTPNYKTLGSSGPIARNSYVDKPISNAGSMIINKSSSNTGIPKPIAKVDTSKCIRCGTRYQPSARFCGSCGIRKS